MIWLPQVNNVYDSGAMAPRSKARVTACFDARVELLAVAHLLAAPSLFRVNRLRLGQAAKRRFARHRGHPGLRALRERLAKGWSSVDAFQLILHSSPPPRLRVEPRPALGWLIARAGGRRVLDEVLAGLSRFAADAGFARFFAECGPVYRAARAELQSQIDAVDLVAPLEAYSGLRVDAEYRVLASPLLERGRELNHVERGRRFRITTAVGPARAEDGRPVFDYGALRWHVWHELSHSLTDPLLPALAERLRGSERLYRSLGGGCRGSWYDCAREHLAQAPARALWLRARRGRKPDWEPLPYMTPLLEELRGLEAFRGSGGTLAGFLPRLVGVFDRLEPAAAEPLDAALADLEALGWLDLVEECEALRARAPLPRSFLLPWRARELEPRLSPILALLEPLSRDEAAPRLLAARGRLRRLLGERDAARADLDAAAARDPGCAEAVAYRGELALMSRPVEALADLDRAIELDGSRAAYHGWRGYARLSLGEDSRALESFNTALELEPSKTWIRLLRGALLKRLGDLARAGSDYERAAKELSP